MTMSVLGQRYLRHENLHTEVTRGRCDNLAQLSRYPATPSQSLLGWKGVNGSWAAWGPWIRDACP
jgi:hypothetical protein